MIDILICVLFSILFYPAVSMIFYDRSSTVTRIKPITLVGGRPVAYLPEPEVDSVQCGNPSTMTIHNLIHVIHHRLFDYMSTLLHSSTCHRTINWAKI